MAATAGRIEPLSTGDNVMDYGERLVRLSRVEGLAGRFLALSMNAERNSDGPANERLAREYAEQAIAIRHELDAWRKANPDPQGRW